MTLLHTTGRIIIMTLFMINELTPNNHNHALSAASINQSASQQVATNNSASQDVPASQDIQLEYQQESSSALEQDEQDEEADEDQDLFAEHDEPIRMSDKFAEPNDPLYKLTCPMNVLLKAKEKANAINKKLILDKVRVLWYKDGVRFRRRINGNKFDYPRPFELALYQFGQSDEATYTCRADFSLVPPELLKDFDTYWAASIPVHMIPPPPPDVAPSISHPPGQIYRRLGENAVFTCNTTVPTLSHQRTTWFRSCPFLNKACVDSFIRAFNKSERMGRSEYLHKFSVPAAFDQPVINVNNITDNDIGFYACVVENNVGLDIRLGRLDLFDNYVKLQSEAKVDSLLHSPIRSMEWVWIAISMAAFFVVAIASVGCIYFFKLSIQRDKKQTAPLITPVVGVGSQGTDYAGKSIDSRRRLPNIEAPDIYNTGKSLDGFISGHLHQATGHLMAQSICSNLLDKATPSISSANSHQSDEASSSWGKSCSDNCRAFYTPASNTTATTVPLYDHPPSTGTLGHCSTFIQSACINNPTYGFLRPENDSAEWSFPRRNLDRLDKIGEGQFGEVWRYVAHRRDGIQDIVAVKQLKYRAGLGDRERLELIAEIEIMKSVNNHPNVIKLLHYCVDECGPTLLIMEYAEKGKLQTYLRKCREPRQKEFGCSNDYTTSPRITSRELLKFTYHIAKGMEYVASQGIVHRDLASRNILVSEDRVCKVADFGFARRVNDECAYERTTTNPVPVKWMAPEALVGNKFTSKSDVFSLGILMWEIVTLGATPYEQLTSEGVYKKVTTGGRLERPPHCKDEFYNLMAQCWLHDPVQRPTFREVACQLEKLLLSENDYIELDQYPEHAYYNILNTAEKEVVNIDT